mgnify:CR=1 FL=1
MNGSWYKYSKSIHELVARILVRKFKRNILRELREAILQNWQVTSSTIKSILSFTFSDSHRGKDSRYAFRTFLSRSFLPRKFSEVWECRTWLSSLFFPGILTHMEFSNGKAVQYTSLRRNKLDLFLFFPEIKYISIFNEISVILLSLKSYVYNN